MTGAMATSEPRDIRIGPGRLVLVVGPSGAGKDTLLDLARHACAGDDTIVFARRVVTRAASPFENNEQMTPDSFRQALAEGAFAIHWEAHGLLYGLRSSINDDIAAGRTVVANVSRAVVDALREIYAHVVGVSVTVPPEVLAARLAGRSRTSDGDAGARLRRTVASPATYDAVIENVGPAEDHAAELLRVIRPG
jgi:ribose 1,5-bisphosphokinase